MTLQGALKDFSVGDVLQLIGQQQKTGTLKLMRNDGAEEAAIHFAKGQVVGVESCTRPARERIGTLLVRANVITDSQLLKALATHKKTMRRVGDVMLQNGWVDNDTLRTFVTLQRNETLYHLFTWSDGVFHFTPTQVVHLPSDAMRSESVLLEGYRQLDEWPMIRAKIPTPTSCYMAVGALDRVPAKRMTSQVEQVFRLIRAERNVDTLIGISRLGSFETSKALWVLLECGVIEAVADHNVGASHGRASAWFTLMSRGARISCQWIAVVLFLGAMGWMLWHRLHTLYNTQGVAGDAALMELLRR